jgi:hypothetical protein
MKDFNNSTQNIRDHKSIIKIQPVSAEPVEVSLLYKLQLVTAHESAHKFTLRIR